LVARIKRFLQRISSDEIAESKQVEDRSTIEDKGDPTTPDVNPSDTEVRIHFDVPQLSVGIAQSKGIQRDKNEDSLFSLTTNLFTNDSGIQFGLFMIADGMGGHENGEVASSIATKIVSDYIISRFFRSLVSLAGVDKELSIQEIVRLGIDEAHKAIKKETPGGGSTLSLVLIMGSQMTIGHVGDSRVYLLSPDGNLQLLTKDHSLAKRLEEIGEISPEQASNHPQRNYLYRALGQGESLEPDIATYFLQPQSQIILCTDGLWGVISEKDIIQSLQLTGEPKYSCQLLVNKANALGGPDNITVILVRVPDES
jgi:serine/threonine protein phosphatase PrpC